MSSSGRSASLTAALAAIVVGLCAAAPVCAETTASLGASFSPYRLGARTTIELSFQFGAPAGQLPSALTEVEVQYPSNLGIAFSGLGLALCSASALEAAGASGCPANSIMGHGSARAELRFGTQLVSESATISIARAPDQAGHIALLLYVSGPSPVNTQILSPAQILPAGGPFGGRLDIQVPLVASVPGAPDLAIVQLGVTLGPQGLTYYEELGGRVLAYQPSGIPLPPHCPRGGFPFAGAFTFADGSRVTARTVVSCPRSRAHSSVLM
ncbi:MAG TPA: hypothetical protein VHT29_12485 [Solirubrobacteraceae bacterium]|nr:hypothetical protein [Solirubrobacteraceae bacterium]